MREHLLAWCNLPRRGRAAVFLGCCPAFVARVMDIVQCACARICSVCKFCSIASILLEAQGTVVGRFRSLVHAGARSESTRSAPVRWRFSCRLEVPKETWQKQSVSRDPSSWVLRDAFRRSLRLPQSLLPRILHPRSLAFLLLAWGLGSQLFL